MANAIDGCSNIMVNCFSLHPDFNTTFLAHGEVMNFVRLGASVSLCLSLFMITGCNSKQGKQDTTQSGNAAAVASPQEQADARAAAQVILAQLTAGDFAKIYQDASPGFKKIGSEAQFVAKFQQVRQRVGVLKNPHETSFATLPNKGHVLVYRLENELYATDMRLSFERARDGKMLLAGLNQHDELKK